MNKTFLAMVLVMGLVLAGCSLPIPGVVQPEPSVPAIGAAVEATSAPIVQPTQVSGETSEGKIEIAPEGMELVLAGYSVVGDVAVGSSVEGPWSELYDDKVETGLVVVFSQDTWVLAPWGATAVQTDPEELVSQQKDAGCGLPDGCVDVIVVNWPIEAEALAAQYAPTPVPTSDPGKWVLADPPGPEGLPNILRGEEILYQQPPTECAVANNPQETCSTREGQATAGSFILHTGEGLLMTGDAIDIGEGGKILSPRPYDGQSVHDLWLLVNLSDADWQLYMSAPYGSFRGYFTAPSGWNEELVAHLRDLHLNLFNLPTQTWERFYPTPVPNCGSPEGCPFVNVRVGIEFGGDVRQWFNGFWDEVGIPHWTPKY